MSFSMTLLMVILIIFGELGLNVIQYNLARNKKGRYLFWATYLSLVILIAVTWIALGIVIREYETSPQNLPIVETVPVPTTPPP